MSARTPAATMPAARSRVEEGAQPFRRATHPAAVAATERITAATRRRVTSHADGCREAPEGNGPGGSGTTAALGPSTPVRATRPRATAAAAVASRPRRVPSERGAVDAGWVTVGYEDCTGG